MNLLTLLAAVPVLFVVAYFYFERRRSDQVWEEFRRRRRERRRFSASDPSTDVLAPFDPSSNSGGLPASEDVPQRREGDTGYRNPDQSDNGGKHD
jgi:hypothetical protein